MCGRFSQTTNKETLAQKFRLALKDVPPLKPRYNVAPSQPVFAVIQEHHRSHVDWLNWGLVPAWSKDPSIGNRMINARAETVSEKPSFKGLLKNSRCIVLADGFYEWQRQVGSKQPYYIQLKSKEPFAMAGLWSQWCSSDGSEIRSCAIITTRANALMKPIHERMPVVLDDAGVQSWMNKDAFHARDVLPLLQPFPSEAMKTYPVSTEVNSPFNDTVECLTEVKLN